MSDNLSLPPLVEALLEPSRYPHPVKRCELIETHISWVILAGEYAYKLKKPLDLGFLDFSTLERRRHCCEEELRLNRRLAPSIYLDCIAITGTPQQPLFAGTGPVIEYAVKMRRFDQQAQLDRMLAAGELGRDHIDAFARLAADFHLQAEVAGEQSPYGSPEQIWQPMEENFIQIVACEPSAAQRRQLDDLQCWSEGQWRRLAPLLARRKAEGRVRECHGDMHLANLAWVEGGPIAFDGIEFNPALRWIDIINDVAFLVMDLQARDCPALAQRFLNRYLELGGDYEALELLPFYKVYRALVRAKVAAIRATQAGGDRQAHEQARRELQCYLDLAQSYTRSTPPCLIITRGMSASGKSTVTSALLERLGAIRLRSDVERKRLFGLAPEADARAEPGKGIYSAEASQQTYDHLLAMARRLLLAGYTVIVDAVFQQAGQRAPFEALAKELGSPWLILELEAAPEALRKRISERSKGISDADLEVLEQQLARWQPLSEPEREQALIVDTTDALPDGAQLALSVSRRLAMG